MRLTLHTDYALRLLMLLAAEPGEPRTIADVARRHGISRHHLVKVTQTLVRAGFLNAQRGRGGGLALARPAAQIGLGEVVRATEDNFALVECFDRASNQCLIAGACGLQSPLGEAVKAFLATLDRHTLADLVAHPQRTARMRRILAQAL
ncbi:MAG: HTH-type transcriptional regulator NsrR [Pseudomonadota bacterium]|jgi:Rrf2 family nitric oxide-sensitive transcriptional repressor